MEQSSRVNDVLRKRRNDAEPVGWKTFATALHHLNVPQDLVRNPERWKYIREKGLLTSLPVLTPQIHPRNVALSSLKSPKETESQELEALISEKETPVARKKTKPLKHKRKQQVSKTSCSGRLGITMKRQTKQTRKNKYKAKTKC